MNHRKLPAACFTLAAIAFMGLCDVVFAQGAPSAKGASAPAAAAAAGGNTGVPNALQGFSQNKDKPVQIEAAQLDVRDKDKVAIFSGNVVVTQGDTIMKCKTLNVFYEQDDPKGTAAKNTMKAAQPGPGGKQSIKRLEARGGVIVIQKEQTATGETGIFEMKTNTVTLVGGAQGVVVTQGTNVLRGERLVVDLTTGYARVESGKGKTVQGIFSTNKDDKPGKDEKPGAGTSGQAKDAQKPSGKKPAPSAAAPSAAPFPAPIGQPPATADN
jgi:lipopolysaccharide export system protein LptA